MYCESPSSSQLQWPCGWSPSPDASIILILVSLFYSKSTTIRGQREWRWCLRCNDASNSLVVVLLLYWKSNSSSQRKWPCCLRWNDTSNSLTAVLLLCCETHGSSQQCEWRCCWRCQVASNNLTVVFSFRTASGRVVPVLRRRVILLQ